MVEENKGAQAEVVRHCDVTQPRLKNLLRDRLSHFLLDTLVNIAAVLGRSVDQRRSSSHS